MYWCCIIATVDCQDGASHVAACCSSCASDFHTVGRIKEILKLDEARALHKWLQSMSNCPLTNLKRKPSPRACSHFPCFVARSYRIDVCLTVHSLERINYTWKIDWNVTPNPAVFGLVSLNQEISTAAPVHAPANIYICHIRVFWVFCKILTSRHIACLQTSVQNHLRSIHTLVISC